jgi:glucose/arabinose dehydrogenase
MAARGSWTVVRAHQLELLVACVVALVSGIALIGQQASAPASHPAPLVFDTFTPGPCSPNGGLHGGCNPGTLVRVRLATVASGLMRPWAIAFLPDSRNTMLVTEMPGRLRVIRDGKLDPQPVDGWTGPALQAISLFSVAVHPQFAQNQFVYLSYTKGTAERSTMALARAKFDGAKLSDVKEIFVADAWGTGAAAGRAKFGPDGMLYLTVGDRDNQVFTENNSSRLHAQDLASHVGKVLRLRDDGTAAPDNPFVNKPGAKPEIYTYGHRNVHGLAWHPDTRELWAVEIGPMGGDELNILKPGANYGWPHVSLGRIYTGSTVSNESWFRPGMEMPQMFWVPAISPSSLAFYTGDRIPLWKGHIFIGGLSGQQVQRVAFSQPLPQQERRDSMFTVMDTRFRDVVMGPDGYLYLATEKTGQNGPGSARNDSPDGTILRIEPVQ